MFQERYIVEGFVRGFFYHKQISGSQVNDPPHTLEGLMDGTLCRQQSWEREGEFPTVQSPFIYAVHFASNSELYPPEINLS